MIGVIDSDHAANFMNPIFGGTQEMLCNINSSAVQILQGRYMKERTEFPAQAVFADAESLFQSIQSVDFLKIIIKKMK